MGDKSEDFVLTERTDLGVVSVPERDTVIVREKDSSVVTTQRDATVSIEALSTVVVSEGQVGPQGPQGLPGIPGTGAAALFSALNASGITIFRGMPVVMEFDGTVGKADAAAKWRVIGLVADASIDNNTFGNLQAAGQLDASEAEWDVVTGLNNGLIKGARYFLSATAGRITTTPDLNNVVAALGRASSSTRMAIDIEPPILP